MAFVQQTKGRRINLREVNASARLYKMSRPNVQKILYKNWIGYNKLDKVNEKISKLTAMSDKLEKLTTLPDQQADKVIENATSSINK